MKTVTAAIIRDGARILLTRRKPGQKLEGYWEFPGGKLEEGESLQTCVEREIQEELNWKIKAGEVVATSYYTYEHGSIKLVAIEAVIVSGDPIPTVHDKIEWVPVSRLLKYKLAPADIPIAEALMIV